MIDQSHDGEVSLTDFKVAMTDDIHHPEDGYAISKEMLTRPSTYAVTGYICGSLANFARPEIARAANRILFPLGGAILLLGAYEQAKQHVHLTHSRMNILREEMIYHAQIYKSHLNDVIKEEN